MRQQRRRASYLSVLFLSVAGLAFPVCASQTDIPGPIGSGAFGATVTALPNGNFVVTDPDYSVPSGASNVGAVYLYDGATLAVISTLTGSTANDQVGSGGVTILANGNFVAASPQWNNAGTTRAGAVTWGSATAGVSGTVTSGNSLIGGTASDTVGGDGVTALTNGNYVVASSNWTNPANPGVTSIGAATWCNGTGGTVGLLTASNSLIGGTTDDNVGLGGATALTNGNYVIASPNWSNPSNQSGFSVGAATWGNGAGGTVGLVASGNSLIGKTGASDDGSNSGDNIGSDGVTALTNGNYVVASSNWSNGVGAVTWGNGTAGTVGVVASGNSLVGHRGASPDGSTSGDNVGVGGVTALTNGDYVAASPNWSNGIGAATWGNGTGGTVGLVSSGNSLIGSTGASADGSNSGDNVGGNGVTALTNGNYVVASSNWSNGVGAATWGSGTGGISGVITSGNSLIGGTGTDSVGSSGVTALSNGNYVVASPNWTNPANPAATAVGAATWGNGAAGTAGMVAPGNSLIGGTTFDAVSGSGVTALTNGNYVVASSNWTNPANPSATQVGAVTWGNGTSGTAGSVTPGNSLIGGTMGDAVGGGGAAALSNGNYVISSINWTNPSNPSATHAGAVTWGNGTGGTVGLVASSNSLIGGTMSDQVGSGGATALSNGDFVVLSNLWNNPAGPIASAGAASFGFEDGTTTGLITSANSVLGTTANGVNTFDFDYIHNHLVVGRAASNIVTVFAPLIVQHFQVTAPALAAPGTTFQVTVTAQTFDNATVTDYAGTVHFTSTSAAAMLPSDYPFVSGDNGTHTFTITLNTPGTQTVTATDTVATAVTGTSSGIQVVSSLAFASPASAAPNPAGVGQIVAFSASVSGNVGTTTYTWNFGDFSPVVTGASVTHAYAASGIFTATVSVTDTTLATVVSTISVTVNAAVVGIGADSDGDGFSDSFESAVNTNPNDSASTPTGSSITVAGLKLWTISKASIKLNWAKTPSGADSISFSGKIPVPANFIPAGANIYFAVSGVSEVLTLKANGSAVSGRNSARIALKKKRGAVLANPAAAYTVTFNKGSFTTLLASAGLTNSTETATVVVPFTFIFNATVYQKIQNMTYTAKVGKTGMAK